jgi:hypothetical protein
VNYHCHWNKVLNEITMLHLLPGKNFEKDDTDVLETK